MNWSITIWLILMFFCSIVIIGWVYAEYGARQAALYGQYLSITKNIETVLDKEVCESHYNWILRLFGELQDCKYKDKERTHVLWIRFREKYLEFEKQSVSEK